MTDHNTTDESNRSDSPLQIPDEYAGDEATREAYRAGAVHALSTIQATAGQYQAVVAGGNPEDLLEDADESGETEPEQEREQPAQLGGPDL